MFGDMPQIWLLCLVVPGTLCLIALRLSIDCRNEAVPDWPRAPMAVPQVAGPQDGKGKGRMNESTIKQELEHQGHEAQVGLLK